MKTIIIFSILLTTILTAKVVTVEGYGTYSTKYDGGPVQCRKIALENAKIDAMEKIGSAIQSEFTLYSKNGKTEETAHDFSSYSAGIMKTQIISESFSATDCSVTLDISI